MRRAVVIAILVCSVSSAHADKKKHETAQWLSGGGVAVSSVLALGGFVLAQNGEAFNQPLLWTGIATSVVTPSFGQWYAGEWLTIGMAVRIGAAGLATYAIENKQSETVCLGSTSANPTYCKGFTGTGVALLGIAAIAFVGGAAYDVADAPEAVDRYNAKHAFMIAPMPMASPQGLVPGVSISGAF
ncbi:MAG: hypothetical protein JWO36_2171 [Myxococcales bacterium]|nr:hypothetical protein [Myxococcales bacterium]